MAEHTARLTPAGRTRIDIRDEQECRYWCRELGVRPKMLKTAVRQVGDRPEDVRRHLKDLMNVRVDTTG